MSFVDIELKDPEIEVRHVVDDEDLPSDDCLSGSYEILFDGRVGKVSLDFEEVDDLIEEIESILCKGKWPDNHCERDISYYPSEDGTAVRISFSVDKVWILSTTTFILSWDKLHELYLQLVEVLHPACEGSEESDEDLFELLKQPHLG